MLVGNKYFQDSNSAQPEFSDATTQTSSTAGIGVATHPSVDTGAHHSREYLDPSPVVFCADALEG